MLNKKYKALIIDCDGTLIPNKIDGIPSARVTEALSKVNHLIHVGIATSRPLFLAIPIMKHLNLSGPSIVSGGAQIVDGSSFKTLKEQQINRIDILAAISVFKKFKLNYLVQDGSSKDKEMTPNLPSQKAIEIAVMGLDIQVAEELSSKLSEIDGLSVQKIVSWQDNKIGIVITHISANKQHGILEVARILGINTDEIIGVGDGYNDFPLLMACGLKVAMGNAVKELKEIADYIAPSVEDDGVADVINKFVI